MSRFVQAAPKAPTLRSAEGAPEDNYATRVAKYVPTEIVATYIFVNGLLLSVGASSLPGGATIWSTFVFGMCWILTPVYLRRVARANEPKRLQIVLSSIAFPIWAYAIGGAVFVGYLNNLLASILIAIFSLISGAFIPTEGEA